MTDKVVAAAAAAAAKEAQQQSTAPADHEVAIDTCAKIVEDADMVCLRRFYQQTDIGRESSIRHHPPTT